ncbi:hypothetical protein, partial [Streptomyces sp. WAC 01325]|uniref:hypothetical protein n=1 Tax=Streptomyces sp. WAC 01325 TaxID=2203202 RepID=UPI001C8EE730
MAPQMYRNPRNDLGHLVKYLEYLAGELSVQGELPAAGDASSISTRIGRLRVESRSEARAGEHEERVLKAMGFTTEDGKITSSERARDPKSARVSYFSRWHEKLPGVIAAVMNGLDSAAAAAGVDCPDFSRLRARHPQFFRGLTFVGGAPEGLVEGVYSGAVSSGSVA